MSGVVRVRRKSRRAAENATRVRIALLFRSAAPLYCRAPTATCRADPRALRAPYLYDGLQMVDIPPVVDKYVFPSAMPVVCINTRGRFAVSPQGVPRVRCPPAGPIRNDAAFSTRGFCHIHVATSDTLDDVKWKQIKFMYESRAVTAAAHTLFEKRQTYIPVLIFTIIILLCTRALCL